MALSTADDFALRIHNYGRFTGMSLAVHAVKDAFFLQHGGVGCKQKGANQIMPHDMAHPALHRQGYTEVDERALIMGSASRIGPYIRSWHRKRELGFMVVTSVGFLDMTGEDFAAAAEAAASTVPFPVEYIPSRGSSGDLYEGYGEVVGRILRHIPFRSQRPKARKVAVVGYSFDRYEPDVAADMEQMRRLLGALGLEVGAFLLGGCRFSELLATADSGRLLCLPYCRAIPAKAFKGIGRPLIRTGLPVGLAGTIRWLRDVAQGCGIGEPVVDGVVRREMARVRPGLKAFRRRIRGEGLRAAVFAETPLAAALAVLMAEIGIPPVLVGLRDETLGGIPAFREEVARAGGDLPGDLEVLENPSLDVAQRKIRRLAERGQPGVLLGSTYETVAAEQVPGRVCIEIGFPRVSYHPGDPSPIYGFEGVLHLCRRILAQREGGRSPSSPRP